MPDTRPAPVCYVEWINQHLGFNPRSQQQSDYLSECVVRDLKRLSPTVKRHLDTLTANYKLNMSVSSRVVQRVVDLVMYDSRQPGPLNQARLSVEHKTIMTAHGRARKNRLGDIVAYCNHMHNHSLQTVAAATMTINISSEYANPDGFATDVTRRQISLDYIRETMELFTNIPLRDRPDEPGDQPEALTVIIVEYDGLNEARLVTDYPALAPDSPHHYTSFCERLIRLYEERFGS